MTDPGFITGDTVNDEFWSRVPTRYLGPDPTPSVLEMTVTLALFFATWVAATWSSIYSTQLAMSLSLGISAFIVRLFMIRHDCFRERILRSSTRVFAQLAKHHLRRKSP